MLYQYHLLGLGIYQLGQLRSVELLLELGLVGLVEAVDSVAYVAVVDAVE